MEAKAKFSDDEVVIGGSLMHSDKPDFSGWATKAGLKCTDGRTIMPDAFKHQDKMTVPLVWQHNHDTPDNVLGHVVLENRGNDGVYCYGYFNGTPQAENSKTLVSHKDIKSLSIYANQLIEKSKQVFHGVIREVSLCLAGANPGALIDNITLAHADGDMVTLEDEAIIYTGLPLEHADNPVIDDPEDVADQGADEADETDNVTVQQVYDSMTGQQKEVVHYFVGAALEDAKQNLPTATHSKDGESKDDNDNNDKKGRSMSRNVFEQQNEGNKGDQDQHVLTHDAMRGIFEDAASKGSLKAAVESYALSHGIENIDVLFPEVRNITDTPEFLSRRVEWVAGVIDGARKIPFTRIKQIVADITYDEARARGYIKGTLKKEEFFAVSRRTTLPTTIYKKQRLDRDDILDITDFDVVVWLKAEMRLMLDEELARAVLIGDGRAADDEDKIKDPSGVVDGIGIRSILNEHELYKVDVNVNLADASSSPTEVVDAIITNMRYYKGSGSPTLYTTLPNLSYMLLARDTLGRRLYRTASDLAAELGVAAIVPVEVMESRPDVFGIIVNMTDYTIGTDKGGEVNFFDFFDIDYNQYKYLLETRCVGALTKIRSALVVWQGAAAGDTPVVPTEPTFDGSAITIVNTPNVVYTRADTGAVVNAAGSPIAVPDGETLEIVATPAAGHYFSEDADTQWTFMNTPGA
jgi:hypothetical protein